ncbi:hypothetical protein Emed_005279 [Eimeria media]
MRFFGSIRLIPIACVFCSGIQLYHANAADTPELVDEALPASEPQIEQPVDDVAAPPKEEISAEDTISQASTTATETFEVPSTTRTEEEEPFVPPADDDTQAALQGKRMHRLPNQNASTQHQQQLQQQLLLVLLLLLLPLLLKIRWFCL